MIIGTTESLHDGRPELPSSPLPGIDILTDATSEEWQQAERVEYEAFRDAGYVTNPEELALEYQPYLPASVMGTVRHRGRLLGAVRLIFESPIGFKTDHDIRDGRLRAYPEGEQLLREVVDGSQAFETGTIGVDPALKQESPAAYGYGSASLYGTILGISRLVGRPYVIASFDARYLEGFSGRFGPSVVALGPGDDYIGSKTVPVALVAESAREHLAVTSPAAHKRVEEVANSFAQA
jgi:hypothetical protein